MYVIYALVDPRDNQVRYVGITDNVYKRFLDHIQCTGKNVARNTWITELRNENVMVQMVELERTENSGLARVREAYWITHYQTLQNNLTNVVHNTHKFVGKVLIRSNAASRRQQRAFEAGMTSRLEDLLAKLSQSTTQAETKQSDVSPKSSPDEAPNVPVEQVPMIPFVAEGRDRIVPDDKHEDLAYFYAQTRDVKKALGRIGLGHDYHSHASWILENRGLKARRA